MFCQKHRRKIASLRIGKHRIVKKTEHRPPLPQCVPKMQLDETTMSEALLYNAHGVFMRNLSESYAGSAALCTLDSK